MAIISVRVFIVFANFSTFNALYCFCIAESFDNSRLEFQQFSFQANIFPVPQKTGGGLPQGYS